MIKFSLRCDKGHGFEGWFRNSEDFDRQTESGFLQCPSCGSESISKALMAPAVSGTRSQDKVSGEHSQPVAAQPSAEEQAKLQKILKEVRDHVVANSDYVGDKFAEEARKMHFNETAKRGIYGEATQDEVKGLAEDGIDCLPLPTLPEDQN
ncbi:MAG: DUF1178 family protein [Cohaesibacter sp.]|nr:DUF1178 family protein [Cohaesibacter sp.]